MIPFEIRLISGLITGMSPGVVGQRCMSEREPELGLGVVASVDASRIGIAFPATGEKRLYALGTAVLKRVQFRAGETIVTRDGAALLIESLHGLRKGHHAFGVVEPARCRRDRR